MVEPCLSPPLPKKEVAYDYVTSMFPVSQIKAFSQDCVTPRDPDRAVSAQYPLHPCCGSWASTRFGSRAALPSRAASKACPADGRAAHYPHSLLHHVRWYGFHPDFEQ